MAKSKHRDMTALMVPKQPEQAKPQGGKKTKTTIVFDADDEAEIHRIEDVLRSKGVRVTEATKVVRVALRAAFAEKTDAEVQTICQELAEKWKRGG